MRRSAVILLSLAGCAMAARQDPKILATDASGTEGLDATEAHLDAPGGGSGSGSGSGACTPQQVELLKNPAFDLAPEGASWVQVPANASYPLITTDDGIAEQSPTEKAWLGGLVSSTDKLYQDVTIPPLATALVLTGYYEVRTGETANVVYDRGSITLTTTAGAVIEPALALDNTHPTTAWTPINHAFATLSAGQTVRLFITTTNNASNETSFYFDTLSLQATACP